MLGATIKPVGVQQAKLGNKYKNTGLKLLKVSAAIRFNEMCKIIILNRNFSKEQSMLPEDDHVII